MKFTEKETNFIDCLNKYWKYIARDKDETLYLFRYKPVKETDYYDSEGSYICIDNIVKDDLFKCITFDGGPVRISKDILDDAEKRYLNGVIKPFKDRVQSISKRGNPVVDYLSFKLADDTFELPYFESGKMYKNMEYDKEYSLKQLGL